MARIRWFFRGTCDCRCGTFSKRGCTNGWHCHGPGCNA